MKKIILLLTLSVLLTSCYALEMGNYRNCSYNEEDGLYYDWREYPKKVPCTSLNKKIEKSHTSLIFTRYFISFYNILVIYISTVHHLPVQNHQNLHILQNYCYLPFQILCPNFQNYC